MSLKPSNRLGPYVIVSPLGVGGMGEVYRARDTRLDRDVAIKVLPESVANDPERLTRFEREAKALASLNHPSIAALYGLEEGALVMELVPGQTLAEVIAERALPWNEALRIAEQIADALEAAHEKRIVHRDLKPANIKVTPSGLVKVLDFGLAKVVADVQDLSNAERPTKSLGGTTEGMVLGTVGYMAPEQARGQNVDHRVDIWAFGVVLYEMLTGKKLFDGHTASDQLAAVLTQEPDLTIAPPQAHRLLRACLEKDPKRRLRDIADARRLVEDVPAVKLSRPKMGLVWTAVGACALLTAVGWLRPQHVAVRMPELAFSILPSSSKAFGEPVVSPDGTSVIYGDGAKFEWRHLNSLQPETLQGFAGISDQIFWSPNSQSVAFSAGKQLKRMRLPDGAVETVAQLRGPTRGGAWSERGAILFCQTTLFMAPADGGTAHEVQIPGLKSGMYYNPQFLPGGEDFLVGFLPDDSTKMGLYVVTLRNGKPADPVLVLSNDTTAQYTSAGGGRLLFVRDDNLYSQRFDREKRKVWGEPELMARGVASDPMRHLPAFSVSDSGVVAWRPGSAALSQVTVFDRQGHTLGTTGPPSTTMSLRLSRDGTRLLADAENDGARILEPGRPGSLDIGRDPDWNLWSPDGNRLIGAHASEIVERAAAASGETRVIAQAPDIWWVEDVSPDGTVALYHSANSIFSVRLDGMKDKPRMVLPASDSVFTPRFSPDGKWIVYRSRGGLFIQPFPGPGLRTQIADRGVFPFWRGDGKEILYAYQKQIWSIPIVFTGGEAHPGTAKPLFPVRLDPGVVPGMVPLAATSDGSKIYLPQAIEQPDSPAFQVKMGWESSGGR